MRNARTAFEYGPAAFEFHRHRATFLHQPASIAHGVGDADLIAHEGHVGDHHCALRAPADGSHVPNHVVHGDFERVIAAQDHHAQRIAHQQDVDAGRRIGSLNLGYLLTHLQPMIAMFPKKERDRRRADRPG